MMKEPLVDVPEGLVVLGGVVVVASLAWWEPVVAGTVAGLFLVGAGLVLAFVWRDG